MKYIVLAIIGIFILHVMCGGSIYYPTSYRAFIPKALDSEYKEYQRLCKEEINKVVYARPITQEEKATLIQGIRDNLIESEKSEIGRKIPITDESLLTIKKEKNIDEITPELWQEMLAELDKRIEAIVQKELAKKEVLERIESKILYKIPSATTLNTNSKSIVEVRQTFSLSNLHTRNRYKEHIFYQAIVGYIYDRHWSEFILFTKGSPISKKFLECKKDNFKSEILLQMALNNRESIGLESDVILTDYYTFRELKKWGNK
ncbi:hypothetical protein [Helicobacter japonicus]|uniref:hypothetical protein n=1 Tax=Helicobacter japonicus TaxID=425400 RepID=UPI001F157EBE|nr:hypothetical protein [Helicobacter japonicus]